MDIVGENLRRLRQPPAADRLGALLDALAQPIARAYDWLGSAPPAVYLQVLLLTLPALWGVSKAGWAGALGIAAVAALGHLLLHAGRLLGARRGATGWTILLDRFTRRIQETALVAAAWWMESHPLAGFPALLPAPWRPLGPGASSAVLLGAAAALLAHHALASLHDLLVLRSHLTQSRRAPGPTALGGPAKSLAPPRDLPMLLWLATLPFQQWQLFGILLVAIYSAATLVTVARFRSRTLGGRIEDEAGRILASDYL